MSKLIVSYRNEDEKIALVYNAWCELFHETIWRNTCECFIDGNDCIKGDCMSG